MSREQDLATIAEQERLLRFNSFSSETAWALGGLLRRQALGLDAAMSFEIQVAGRTLFSCITHDAPASQADWIRRKRNSVMRFGRSTYALGLELDGKTIEQRHGLSELEFAMHGGGFPILLPETGLVGSVIASGLPQRQDHNLVVSALAALTGIAVPHLE